MVAPLQTRIHERALLARVGVREDERPPLRVDPLGPCLLGIGSSLQVLPGLTVQEIEEGIAVRGGQKLSCTPAVLHIYQYLDLISIPVVNVVWGVLEVPAQFPRRWLECDHRACVEIVARTNVTVPVGPRVASPQ